MAQALLFATLVHHRLCPPPPRSSATYTMTHRPTPSKTQKNKQTNTNKNKQENGFEPLYIQNVKKKPIINRLKKASAKCDEIILATDEDREGEAISWHLLQVSNCSAQCKYQYRYSSRCHATTQELGS